MSQNVIGDKIDEFLVDILTQKNNFGTCRLSTDELSILLAIAMTLKDEYISITPEGYETLLDIQNQIED